MKQTLAFGCCLLLALQGRAQDSPKPITVPFTQIETGHFMIKVKLNDKGPYNLIFDTGAPMTLIDNRIAKDSGVIKTANSFFFGAMTTPQTIKKFKLGDLEVEKVTTMVMDHPTVSAFSRFYEKKYNESIDGIVGFPFFARFATTVNYQTKELKFVPNGYQPEDVMQGMMKTMMAGSSGKQGPKVLAPGGYWGFSFAAKSDEAAGIPIEKLFPGGPADKAGLKVGDRLLTLDGRWTDSISDAYNASSFVKPGKAVELVIKRDGVEKAIKVAPETGL
jgi:hypothetical protein